MVRTERAVSGANSRPRLRRVALAPCEVTGDSRGHTRSLGDRRCPAVNRSGGNSEVETPIVFRLVAVWAAALVARTDLRDPYSAPRTPVPFRSWREL